MGSGRAGLARVQEPQCTTSIQAPATVKEGEGRNHRIDSWSLTLKFALSESNVTEKDAKAQKGGCLSSDPHSKSPLSPALPPTPRMVALP